jgi:hypothetical protein
LRRKDDVLNAGGALATAERLRPDDYVKGRGYSEGLSAEFRDLLDSMDGEEVNPADDCSWGYLKPEYLAQDIVDYDNMRSKGLV